MYSQTAQAPSFLSFLVDDNQNHKYLRLVVIACAVQFVVFKILYPFPDFFSDPYGFIDTAAKGENFNIWPIGYSKFLSAVRIVTSSSLAVVAIQYVVVTACSAAFFYTILYFYNPHAAGSLDPVRVPVSEPGRIVPLQLHLQRSVVFRLSLLWFTQLLWILHQPQRWHIAAHTVLLFIIFTLRYHALYYPRRRIGGLWLFGVDATRAEPVDFEWDIEEEKCWRTLFSTLDGQLHSVTFRDLE